MVLLKRARWFEDAMRVRGAGGGGELWRVRSALFTNTRTAVGQVRCTDCEKNQSWWWNELTVLVEVLFSQHHQQQQMLMLLQMSIDSSCRAAP